MRLKKRWLVILSFFLFLNVFGYEIDNPTTGYASNYSFLSGDFCPSINWNKYKNCQAICPKGGKPLTSPNQEGIYECLYEGTFANHKCTYINPYCLKKVKTLQNTYFNNPLGNIPLTEYVLRTVSLDPALYNLVMNTNNLQVKGQAKFFIEVLNQSFPIFLNFAYFIFILVFFLALIYLGILKTLDWIRGEEGRVHSIDLGQVIVKSMIVLAFFGLPIKHNASNNGKYVSSATPLAIELIRYVLVEADHKLEYIAEKISNLYAKRVYEDAISNFQLLKAYLLNLNQYASNEYIKVKEQFQAKCLQPEKKCSGEDTFLVEDEDLANFCFADEGNRKDLSRALYCRNLELKLNALVYLQRSVGNNYNKVEKAYNEFKTFSEKILGKLTHMTKETTQKVGFISTAINIPLIYLKLQQEAGKRVYKLTKEIVPVKVSKEQRNTKDSVIIKVLNAVMIVSIPPFSNFFMIVKSLMEGVMNVVINLIHKWLLAGAVAQVIATGGLALPVIALEFAVIEVVLQVFSTAGATITALVFTYLVALTILQFALWFLIAGAVVFRFITLAIEIFLYVISIPFKLLYIFIQGGSIQAVNDFVRNLTRFTLLMLFITLSPIIGLFIHTIVNLTLDEFFLEAVAKYNIFDNSIIETALLYLIISLVHLISILGTIFIATKITYSFPDRVFGLLSLFEKRLPDEMKGIFEKVSSTISPRL